MHANYVVNDVAGGPVLAWGLRCPRVGAHPQDQLFEPRGAASVAVGEIVPATFAPTRTVLAGAVAGVIFEFGPDQVVQPFERAL